MWTEDVDGKWKQKRTWTPKNTIYFFFISLRLASMAQTKEGQREGHRTMFFQTFDSCGQSTGKRSLDLPVNDQSIDFKVDGNPLTLTVKKDTFVLRWSRRVCSFVQLNERQKLVQRIRRLDEAIGQSALELMKLRNAWRLRPVPHGVPNGVLNGVPNGVPNSLEATKYVVLQKKLSVYNAEFILECTALHQIWTLEPEIGDEHHDWTVPLDGLLAIHLPDLRPGKENQKIKVRFWFGEESPKAPDEAPAEVPAAVVTIVPQCCAPYRPFNVPAVWV